MGFIEHKNALLYDFIFKDNNANIETRVLAFIIWRTHEDLTFTDTQSFIANWLQVDKSVVNRAIISLEKKKYFEREQVFDYNSSYKKIILTKHLTYEDINQIHKTRAHQLKLMKTSTNVDENINTNQQTMTNESISVDELINHSGQIDQTNKVLKDSLSIPNNSYENKKSEKRKKELEIANKKNQRARNKLLKDTLDKVQAAKLRKGGI